MLLRSVVHLVIIAMAACFPGPLDIDTSGESPQTNEVAVDVDATSQAETLPEDTDLPEIPSDISQDSEVVDSADDADTASVDGHVDTADSGDGDGDAVPVNDCDSALISNEPCNGLDDNCNGETDEDFPNSDSDQFADCVDDDDDNDGVLDGVDPNPTVFAANGCDSPALVRTHLGCAFWVVDLPHWVYESRTPPPSEGPVGVAVSNPNLQDAVIEFEVADDVPSTPDGGLVPAGESRVFVMPVVPQQPWGVRRTGIRLTSDRPVGVLQMNPWNGGLATGGTRLLPENSLGTNHTIFAAPTIEPSLIQQPGPNLAGFLAVVSPVDGLEVTIKTRCPTLSGERLIALAAGAEATFRLMRGEVLTMVSAGSGKLLEPSDLTGTVVDTTSRAAVFSGHMLTSVSSEDLDRSCCADHVEEQVLPSSLAGSSFVLIPAKPHAEVRANFWEIMALLDGVDIFSIPPEPGLDNAHLTRRGDVIAYIGAEPVEIQTAGLVSVMQYFSGGKRENPEPSEIGNPAMLAVPDGARFFKSTMFLAPGGFESHATIVRFVGASVKVDGIALDASLFRTFGVGVQEYAWIDLDAGTHFVDASYPIGMWIYGHAPTSSYGTFGGLGKQ